MAQRSADRRQRRLALGLSLICMAVASNCSSEDSKAQGPAADQDKAPVTAAPAAKVDPALLPTRALAELMSLDITASPPCSTVTDSTHEIFELVRKQHAALSEIKDAAAAGAATLQFGQAIEAAVGHIAIPSEPDELRRLGTELKASLHDLAESNQLLAGALSKQDTQLAATTLRRIDNGVSNTRSAFERLSSLCAP